ncbi:MAG: hypothetical protein Q7O66_07395 [Dehalococcoidia bacterium]|nr:hypothetical protein [Dehalococcoidia bacterium]
MKLTMIQRIKLLELLPDRGDNLDLKILRKLKESLSFSEEERDLMSTMLQYKCPFEDRSPEGRVTTCPEAGFFSGPAQCTLHDMDMQPTGKASIHMTVAVMAMEKEVHMGPRAVALCATPLKTLNDNKQLTEGPIEDLYYKFFPEADPE